MVYRSEIKLLSQKAQPFKEVVFERFLAGLCWCETSSWVMGTGAGGILQCRLRKQGGQSLQEGGLLAFTGT